MKKVDNLDDFRPHLANIVICPHCMKGWVAVFPDGTERLECPKCGKFSKVPYEYIPIILLKD